MSLGECALFNKGDLPATWRKVSILSEEESGRPMTQSLELAFMLLLLFLVIYLFVEISPPSLHYFVGSNHVFYIAVSLKPGTMPAHQGIYNCLCLMVIYEKQALP